MKREEIEAIKVRQLAARKEVGEICSGDHLWRMTIPPQMDRDSDMLICAALDDTKALLDERDGLIKIIARAYHNYVVYGGSEVIDDAPGPGGGGTTSFINFIPEIKEIDSVIDVTGILIEPLTQVE